MPLQDTTLKGEWGLATVVYFCLQNLLTADLRSA